MVPFNLSNLLVFTSFVSTPRIHRLSIEFLLATISRGKVCFVSLCFVSLSCFIVSLGPFLLFRLVVPAFVVLCCLGHFFLSQVSYCLVWSFFLSCYCCFCLVIFSMPCPFYLLCDWIGLVFSSLARPRVIEIDKIAI
jgi:hypothetical protein